MRYFASLVVLAALALRCAASDPVRSRMEKRRPIPPSFPIFWAPVQPAPPQESERERLLRAVLFPQRALIQWAIYSSHRGQFTSNVVGLQLPHILPPPDLDFPIRVFNFGPAQ
jgi:hypothetical protein